MKKTILFILVLTSSVYANELDNLIKLFVIKSLQKQEELIYPLKASN